MERIKFYSINDIGAIGIGRTFTYGGAHNVSNV